MAAATAHRAMGAPAFLRTQAAASARSLRDGRPPGATGFRRRPRGAQAARLCSLLRRVVCGTLSLALQRSLADAALLADLSPQDLAAAAAGVARAPRVLPEAAAAVVWAAAARPQAEELPAQVLLQLATALAELRERIPQEEEDKLDAALLLGLWPKLAAAAQKDFEGGTASVGPALMWGSMHWRDCGH
ncbi:unnamed protein product [Prorocentrum cordatum]|uniref:Protein-serine/threonine kinase n=1 Tax=Prorocentrum cordatum TaxID=2364126 RepID=A0ABN9TLN8_9DINO|nr:unnamed protein product [Polarella glacialis]